MKFIGSKRANEMEIVRDLDPAEIAAKVAGLLMRRDGMTQNEALTAFMKSDTFRALVSDAELSSLSPEKILEIYEGRWTVAERFVPSEEDVGVMKAGITLCFAEEYGKSLKDTVDLFEANGIYDYLDRFAGQFINKSFPYMASFISDRLGISYA